MNIPNRYSSHFLMLLLMLALAEGASTDVSAAEPLHTRIDQLIERNIDHPIATLAGDAEFLRRVTIDLTGMPPGPEELQAFLADKSENKRQRAVDRLLESPLFSRQLSTMLDVMFMERRSPTAVPQTDWQAYLLRACRENRPIHLIYQEILCTNGSESATRPAVRFYLDRGSDPNLITRDVGRIFFGRDLQCAQCHNHPLISDYQQTDYHGLLAFFASSNAVTKKEGKTDKILFGESAARDATFDSVFVKNDKHVAAPRVPYQIPFTEPSVAPGDEYLVKPGKDVLPVPRVSRRKMLADFIASGKSRAFNENVANRLWWMMMGRGLVSPLDLHHPENPAYHPDVLRLIADALVDNNFNAKVLLREITLTRAYGRSIDLPQLDPSRSSTLALKIADVKREVDSSTAAVDRATRNYNDAVNAWYAAETALISAVAPIDAAMAKHAEASKSRDSAAEAYEQSQTKLANHREAAKNLKEMSAQATELLKRLPAEKDLVLAGQKIIDRAKSIPAEVTVLEKASAEKSNALKKAEEALVPLAKAVVEARTKAAPAREAALQKEQEALKYRSVLADARSKGEQANRHLKALHSEAAVLEIESRIRSERMVVQSNRTRLVKLEADLKSRQAEIEVAETDTKAVEKAALDAETRVADANRRLQSHREKIDSLQKAVEATDAARKLISEDRAVADAAIKLKERVEQLRTQSSALLSELERLKSESVRSKESVASRRSRLVFAREERQKTVAVQASTKAELANHQKRVLELEQEQQAAVEDLTSHWSADFGLAQFKPLAPEQLAWSLMKVSGVYDRQRNQAAAELEKSSPLAASPKPDPARLAAREFEIEQRVFDKLKNELNPFISMYAAGAGQPQNDFFATADQALFASNGGTINNWIAPNGTNITARVVAEKDPNKAADDLYMTILSRKPSPEESADVAKLLTSQGQARATAAQEIVWGLLMSTEFRFNH